MSESNTPLIRHEHFDVAVIGAGPTGLAAAALLAQTGHRVAILERQLKKYGLPRAGHIDHEVMRILQGLGAHGAILEDAPEPEDYVWFGSEGQEILRFPFSGLSSSGFLSDYMIFQPVLDDALYASLDPHIASGAVALKLGSEVVDIAQSDDYVALTVAEMRPAGNGRREASGAKHMVHAEYVVAADGAGSATRQRLGIGVSGPEIDERWYTVDLKLRRDLPTTINGQWCDPRRPTYVGHLGKRYHRFEMKVLPHERDDLFDEDYTWQLLSQWGVTSKDAELYRRVTYAFECKVADTWQDGRIFLAGDAAHTMPPFMGQGLCSGFRDAATLAWKLDLVLRGEASKSSLGTYETERRQHVAQWTNITNQVGAVSCVLDAEAAASRDRTILARGLTLSGPPSPGPGAFVTEDEHAAPVSPAGDLFPQSECEIYGRRGLFHDLVGSGFIVVAAPEVDLSSDSQDVLSRLNATVVKLGSNSENGTLSSANFYEAWLQERGWVLAVVRPDYYVFGGAADKRDVDRLVDRLSAELALQPTVDQPAGVGAV